LLDPKLAAQPPVFKKKQNAQGISPKNRLDAHSRQQTDDET
jgi:hypothetical protein